MSFDRRLYNYAAFIVTYYATVKMNNSDYYRLLLQLYISML